MKAIIYTALILYLLVQLPLGFAMLRRIFPKVSSKKGKRVLRFLYFGHDVLLFSIFLLNIFFNLSLFVPVGVMLVLLAICFTGISIKVILSIGEVAFRIKRWMKKKRGRGTSPRKLPWSRVKKQLATVDLGEYIEPRHLSRRDFIVQATAATTLVPTVGVAYATAWGAYDLNTKYVRVTIPTLPREANGFRVIQISDLHLGSYANTKYIKQVVREVNALKGEVVLMTGDMVNFYAHESSDYMNILNKITAKHGVYSIMGNHDYGDYDRSQTPASKKQAIKDMMQIHATLGWNLLRDHNVQLEDVGFPLVLVGTDNFGKGRRQQYGNITKAITGIREGESTNIVMTHDPTYWRTIANAPVTAHLTLSGHTHGMQVGIDNQIAKFSPIQFIYPEWKGLYKSEDIKDGNLAAGRQIYVNPGIGFVGFPGRLGILPEVTVLELFNS